MNIEKIYLLSVNCFNSLMVGFVPYFRRVIRFFALPYCYYKNVNWKECTSSPYQVFKDFMFIFFKLKYYPDNYSLCRFWEKQREEWYFYYGSIYDPYQRERLRKLIQPKEYGIVYQDKSICYDLCKSKKLSVPDQFCVIENKDFYKSIIKDIITHNPGIKLIIKPVKGIGGSDIFLIEKIDNEIIVNSQNTTIHIDQWKLIHPSVVQKFIDQHKDLSLMSSSINTVRIVTLLGSQNKVIILGALMRFGVGDSFLDNTSKGGIAIGINIYDGTLKEIGFDFKSQKHYIHPTSNVSFKGFQIPVWDEVLKIAKQVQIKLPYCRLLGQDIAITSEGRPVVIEINDNYDNVGLEQAYGPILADQTILEEFNNYNLFINKYQNNLSFKKGRF